MKPIEIVLNVFSMIFVELICGILLSYFIPKFRKKEIENEQQAKEKKVVRMNSVIIGWFISFSIFASIIGIIIFAFPKFITNVLEFNYLATILVWWIPLIFDATILYFCLTQASYNESEIVVKKVFFKPKSYRFDEIKSFSKTGNLRVKTTKGNFTLLNAMSGTSALRDLLIKNENKS